MVGVGRLVCKFQRLRARAGELALPVQFAFTTLDQTWSGTWLFAFYQNASDGARQFSRTEPEYMSTQRPVRSISWS